MKNDADKFEKWRHDPAWVDPADGERIKRKAMYEARKLEREKPPELPRATLTSGFGLEVLRLNHLDVKFLQDCGIAVE